MGGSVSRRTTDNGQSDKRTGRAGENAPTEHSRRTLAGEVRRHFAKWDLASVWATFENAFQLKGVQPDVNVFISRREFYEIFGVGDIKGIEEGRPVLTLPLFIFRLFDANSTGFANLYEIFMVLALYCYGDMRQKSAFCFRMFDIDSGGDLDPEEIFKFLSVCSTALYHMHELPRPPQRQMLKRLVDELMRVADRNSDGRIQWSEFHEWAQSNRHTRAMMENFRTAAETTVSMLEGEEAEAGGAGGGVDVGGGGGTGWIRARMKLNPEFARLVKSFARRWSVAVMQDHRRDLLSLQVLPGESLAYRPPPLAAPLEGHDDEAHPTYQDIQAYLQTLGDPTESTEAASGSVAPPSVWNATASAPRSKQTPRERMQQQQQRPMRGRKDATPAAGAGKGKGEGEGGAAAVDSTPSPTVGAAESRRKSVDAGMGVDLDEWATSSKAKEIRRLAKEAHQQNLKRRGRAGNKATVRSRKDRASTLSDVAGMVVPEDMEISQVMEDAASLLQEKRAEKREMMMDDRERHALRHGRRGSVGLEGRLAVLRHQVGQQRTVPDSFDPDEFAGSFDARRGEEHDNLSDEGEHEEERGGPTQASARAGVRVPENTAGGVIRAELDDGAMADDDALLMEKAEYEALTPLGEEPVWRHRHQPPSSPPQPSKTDDAQPAGEADGNQRLQPPPPPSTPKRPPLPSENRKRETEPHGGGTAGEEAGGDEADNIDEVTWDQTNVEDDSGTSESSEEDTEAIASEEQDEHRPPPLGPVRPSRARTDSSSGGGVGGGGSWSPGRSPTQVAGESPLGSPGSPFLDPNEVASCIRSRSNSHTIAPLRRARSFTAIGHHESRRMAESQQHCLPNSPLDFGDPCRSPPPPLPLRMRTSSSSKGSHHRWEEDEGGSVAAVVSTPPPSGSQQASLPPLRVHRPRRSPSLTSAQSSPSLHQPRQWEPSPRRLMRERGASAAGSDEGGVMSPAAIGVPVSPGIASSPEGAGPSPALRRTRTMSSASGAGALPPISPSPLAARSPVSSAPRLRQRSETIGGGGARGAAIRSTSHQRRHHQSPHLHDASRLVGRGFSSPSSGASSSPLARQTVREVRRGRSPSSPGLRHLLATHNRVARRGSGSPEAEDGVDGSGEGEGEGSPDSCGGGQPTTRRSPLALPLGQPPALPLGQPPAPRVRQPVQTSPMQVNRGSGETSPGSAAQDGTEGYRKRAATDTGMTQRAKGTPPLRPALRGSFGISPIKDE